MNRFACLIVLLALTCLAVLGAGIDGKWVADGRGKATFTFQSSGDTLTGTMEGGGGARAEISEGVVHGNEITFKVVRDLGGKGKFERNFKGTLIGDELKLTVAAPSEGKDPQERIFKRAR